MRSLRLLFETLGLLASAPHGTVQWSRVATVAILLKGVWLPGWVTCVELAIVCAWQAFRWTLEPKPARQLEPEQAEQLVNEVKELKSEINAVKMHFGFDPNRRFSMFKRG